MSAIARTIFIHTVKLGNPYTEISKKKEKASRALYNIAYDSKLLNTCKRRRGKSRNQTIAVVLKGLKGKHARAWIYNSK